MQTLKPRVQAIVGGRIASLGAPSRTSAYRIRGRALQSIRLHHLAEHPLCVHCLAKDRITAAVEIDHRIPLSKGGTDTPDNRQSLCRECHLLKTVEDLKG